MTNASEDGIMREDHDCPIGASEEDLEAILLDGCLGFGCSVGNAVLILLMSINSVGDGQEGSFVAILMALAVALALRSAQVATDGLQGGTGKRIILYGQVVAYISAIVLLCCNLHAPSVVFGGFGLVATAFLYGRFLSGLARKALALVFDIVFMYVGIMFLIFSQLAFLYSLSILVVSVALSVAISLLFARKDYPLGDLVDAEESKRRSIKVKGNNHTLFLLGFMLSAALMMFFIGFPVDAATVALGASVGLAGILSLLLGQMDERTYKEAMKKSMAFTAAVLLLPLPIVPETGKLICLCLYTCTVSMNAIVLLNAIVETSRFDMISPIWLFGQEGSVFFAGVFAGGVLFAAGGFFSAQFSEAPYVTCLVAVGVCAWMQIRVNYQIYPFEPVIETNLECEIRANIEHDGQHKMLWQEKRRYACERYGLSPREREILQILLKGRDAKYIMDTFYISQSTAKTHIYNIYRKFGIHSRQELLDFIEEIQLPSEERSDEQVESS